jgi:hypothetical protein
MRSLFLVVLFAALMLASCLVRTGRDSVGIVVPPLPSVVIFDSEPYYNQGGYHYHYQNDRWLYSQSRQGPWTELPRSHYPKEIRYRNQDSDDNRGRQDHDQRDRH